MKSNGLKLNAKLNWDMLTQNSLLQEKYNLEVRNKFEAPTEEDNNRPWENFKESLTAIAQKLLPRETKKVKSKWMTQEILDMMDTRRKIVLRDSQEYKEINRRITTKCTKAKVSWLKTKCEEIEKLKSINTRIMHREINEISGRKSTCSSSGCVKSKSGDILLTKEEQLERWSEYIQDLFEDERPILPEIHKNMDGPKIMPEEVRAAICSMKRRKACGPDGITAEMLQATENFSAEKLAGILNDIYEGGTIPEDLTKSIFIALPKKAGAVDCEMHRTISLMSVVIKILLKILMMRMRSKIRPEISEVQCGFMKDTGTRNAIFILRNLCERMIEENKTLYLCFIDYTKAFDRVQHGNLIELLQKLDLDGNDIEC